MYVAQSKCMIFLHGGGGGQRRHEKNQKRPDLRARVHVRSKM